MDDGAGLIDAATAIAGGTRPVIEVLGTYDITLVETTSILLEGELWLFEAVHDNYWNNSIDKPFGLRPHQRFVNMLTGEKTPAFGVEHLFGARLSTMPLIPCTLSARTAILVPPPAQVRISLYFGAPIACRLGREPDGAGPRARARDLEHLRRNSERDAKLAQKLGQFQPFLPVFPLECMGRLASFGPTY